MSFRLVANRSFTSKGVVRFLLLGVRMLSAAELPDNIRVKSQTTSKFYKFDFFCRQLGSKKLFVFFSILGFFEGSWHMLSDWCLRFLNVLLKSVSRIFRQYLVYFLKRYLATNRKLKLWHF